MKGAEVFVEDGIGEVEIEFFWVCGNGGTRGDWMEIWVGSTGEYSEGGIHLLKSSENRGAFVSCFASVEMGRGDTKGDVSNKFLFFFKGIVDFGLLTVWGKTRRWGGLTKTLFERLLGGVKNKGHCGSKQRRGQYQTT